MADVIRFEPGGYRYIKSVFQYSGGVAAEPGFAIERARLRQPVPMLEGFALIERHLGAIGRPLQAFCACELRSPAPFSETGFVDFNRDYVKTLERWGLFKDDTNPVARTNVAPLFGEPTEPCLYAFSYTMPAANALQSFIVAGGGEALEGAGEYRDRIVALGDLSRDGLRQKVRHVIASMESRLTALGFSWADATTVDAYTVHDIGPLIAEEYGAKGIIPGGLLWHLARPPIVDIEFEMDVHAPARQIVIQEISHCACS